MDLPATGTTSPLVLHHLRITGDLHWKVVQRDWTEDSWPTSSSLTATVVSNELYCQLESKLFDFHADTAWAEALLQDEGIGDGDIKQEVENILVKLPALCSAVVVAT